MKTKIEDKLDDTPIAYKFKDDKVILDISKCSKYCELHSLKNEHIFNIDDVTNSMLYNFIHTYTSLDNKCSICENEKKYHQEGKFLNLIKHKDFSYSLSISKNIPKPTKNTLVDTIEFESIDGVINLRNKILNKYKKYINKVINYNTKTYYINYDKEITSFYEMMNDYENCIFKVGDNVGHKIFGKGVIKSHNKNTMNCNVKFGGVERTLKYEFLNKV